MQQQGFKLPHFCKIANLNSKILRILLNKAGFWGEEWEQCSTDRYGGDLGKRQWWLGKRAARRTSRTEAASVAMPRPTPVGVLPYCQASPGRQRSGSALPTPVGVLQHCHEPARSIVRTGRVLQGASEGVYDCTRPSEQRSKARDAPRDKRGKQGPRCAARQAQKKDLRLRTIEGQK